MMLLYHIYGLEISLTRKYAFEVNPGYIGTVGLPIRGLLLLFNSDIDPPSLLFLLFLWDE